MSPKRHGELLAGKRGPVKAADARRAPSRALAGLMAGTAISVLWVAAAGQAEAACTQVGSILTCSGAVSSFQPVTDPTTMLSITGLTADVTATPGNDVINFVSTNGPIAINLANTQTLSASGADADVIEARSLGGQAISLDASGNLVSAAAHGIYVDTAGDIDVTMKGTTSAGLDAITAHGQSTGTIDLNVAGSLTSTSGSGIVADTGIDPGQPGAIKLVNTATINAAVDGINLSSNGSGLLNIQSDADITGTAGYGIYGFSNGSVLSATTGNIVAGTQGLHLESHGDSGTVLATHTGNITTTSDDGVWAEARGAVSVTVTGDIDAGGTGIHAQSAEDTATTVVSVVHTGSLTAHDGYGIEAIGLNGGVIVTNIGSITSTGDAINAYAAGGNVTVDQSGTINSSQGAGIVGHSTTGTVSILGTGTITASGNGVDVLANSGAVSVAQSGDIESGAIGVTLSSLVGNATLTGSGAVTATGSAIVISSRGSGSSSVNRDGAISSLNGIGIDASSTNGSVTITNAGTIEASGPGIKGAANNSTVSINQTGNVTSHNDAAISATSANGAVSVTSSGNLSGETSGVYAHSQYGDVTVDQTGTVTVSAGAGIDAYAANGTISVTADGLITSDADGIHAVQSGGGTLHITASGGIRSASANGILASSTDSNVTIDNTGAIQANSDGINVDANSGNILITQVGNVTSDTGAAISADAPAGSIGITSTGDISAKTYGLYAYSTGGDVSINQTGSVYTWAGEGILAYSATGAASVTVDGAVTAKTDAITVRNAGYSNVTVNATGGVESYDGAGIIAYSPNGAVEVTQKGNLISKTNGIDASNLSGQDVTVTHRDGSLTSNSGSGIVASSSSGNVTVTSTGKLVAELYGINATNTGYGSVKVTQNGDLTANKNDGILASSSNGDVTVNSTGKLVAELYGINATNTGYGSVTVTQNGDLTANKRDGILASSSNGDVTVNSTGKLVADLYGINATNTGYGSVTVTQTGDLTAYNRDGILASSSNGNVSVTSTGTVLADLYGINASNTGNGWVNVTQTGDLTAYNRDGILASSATGYIYVTGSGIITADGVGINASNTSNSNDVEVYWQGAITASNGSGILASSAQADVYVEQYGDINAALDGVNASNLSDDQGVHVAVMGDIVAQNGLVASSARGEVYVGHLGGITASQYGINATNLSDDNDVEVESLGNITAAGNDAIYASSANAAVFVRSYGGDLTGNQSGIHLEGWGSLSAQVDDGTVKGGASGAAVTFVNGASSSLLNYGTLANTSGIDGLAVSGVDTNTSIDNYGTIRGNIDLTDLASNSFENRFGAVFETGSSVDLGSGNWLTNAGIVSPGGEGVIKATSLTGSFENTSTGTLLIDIDGANAATDTLTVSGQAKLNGALSVNLMSLGSSSNSYVFLSAGAGITEEAMVISNPAILGSVTSDGTNATVTIDGVNFSPVSGTPNSRTLGDYFNRSIAASNSLEPILLSLANLSTDEEYNAALQQLSPEVLLAETDAARVANINFTNNLMSCRVADGVNFFGAEGECGWVKVENRRVTRDGDSETIGSHSDSWSFTGGAQFALAPDWRLGFGAGGSTENTDSTYGSSDGSTAYLGAVVKYAPGAALFSAAVSGSYGWYDSTRQVDFGTITDTLTGSPEVATINARLRAAYTFQNDSAYLRPILDLDMIYTRQRAVTETGGIAALSMDASDQTVFSVTPSLEAGTQVALGDDMLLRPYVSGGVSLYSDNSIAMAGIFSSDTGGVAPFNVSTTTDRTLWRASAGVDVFAGETGTLRLYYDGAFGSTTTSQVFGGKFSLKF
ncbi:beta strand repeat-containing protein [Rhizobium sp. SGZ-381]|uniref:beta strand repeat-containing protein n=1 Tax=Rhizobium sp. SGZ-381 TaxID=3342800 RepID=UPI00366FE7F5